LEQGLVHLTALVEDDHEGKQEAEETDDGEDETGPEKDTGEVGGLSGHTPATGLRGRASCHLGECIKIRSFTERSTIKITLNSTQNVNNLFK
jgi:hypothetical protein